VRPLRFLASITEPVGRRAFSEAVRRAEAIGIDTLVFADHLLEQAAPVPAMATVAALSDTLRIGSFVLNNDLRHPAVLAHDLATLDLLSDGRLDVAIGAGWNRREYDAVGIAYEAVGVRVDRLAEAITVLKGCFGAEPFSVAGRHYTIHEFDGQPKPVQRPHPPFMIGGGGRRTLELAAREAQIVGLAPRAGAQGRGDPLSLTWEATIEKIGWVRAAAGDRFGGLELNVYPSTVAPQLTDDAHAALRAAATSIRDRTGVELSEAQLARSPHVFIGSLESLSEKVLALRDELGIGSIMLGEVGELDPLVERLAGRGASA
jgi:probable F420-dependent oxidoreductase